MGVFEEFKEFKEFKESIGGARLGSEGEEWWSDGVLECCGRGASLQATGGFTAKRL
jgi:hypothetical protein